MNEDSPSLEDVMSDELLDLDVEASSLYEDDTFAGGSEFKGRNGYARLARVEAFAPSDGRGDRVRVEFYSRREAQSPPAVLVLNAVDAQSLVGLLTRAVIEMNIRALRDV